MCDLLRTDRATRACRQRRKIKRVKRNELAETNTVNLPGVTAGGIDVRTRWPHPPTRRHVREDGVRLEEVQLRVEIGSLDRLDGRTTPIVVRSVKEQLTFAIDPATPDPDRTCVAGIGGPDNLIRMTGADDLAAKHVHGSLSQCIPEVGAKLAQSLRPMGACGWHGRHPRRSAARLVADGPTIACGRRRRCPARDRPTL